MMHRIALVTVVVAACGGSQLNQRTAELAKYLPATLEATNPREGEARTLKVRVWVDAGVRALTGWKEEITEQVDYASQLLTPLIGVKLAVASINDWTRNGQPPEALRVLAETDKAEDVQMVIGFVTASDTASKVMSELGTAQPLGRYVIVRDWSETAETAVISRTLPDLKDAERTEVLGAHRRHKQTVVLLHMIATTLGAIAETDPTWIQHAGYSPKQTSFSDRNRELMTLAVDERLAEGGDQAIAKKLLEAIEAKEWGGWVTADRDQLVSTLRHLVDAAKSGKTAADIPPPALDQVTRIKQLAKQGKVPDAIAELDNVLAAYPGNASLHQLKCELLLGKPGVGEQTTRAACKRASELAPGDPGPHIAVGGALAKSGDLTAARAELSQAEAKIANLTAGTAEAWHQVIGIYVAMGALTWTEAAIASAKLENDPAAATVAQTRVRYGVPRGTKLIAPEHEAAVVTAVKKALEQIYASKYGEAERTLATAERQWPGAPGLAAARCDLALRQGHTDPARTSCHKALSAQPDQSWALYLSGVIALRDAGGTKTGIEWLKKAIAADPELGQAWRALAKAYQRAKDQPALDQLGKDYQARFGQPLPR